MGGCPFEVIIPLKLPTNVNGPDAGLSILSSRIGTAADVSEIVLMPEHLGIVMLLY
jgi:hypothetical protein